MPNIEVTEGIIYQFNSIGPQSGIILASAPGKEIRLSDHTLYYYQGMSAATNDVQVGDQVKLYLDGSGTIRIVEIVNKASMQQLTGNIFISMDPGKKYINYFENGMPVHRKLASGATVFEKKQ